MAMIVKRTESPFDRLSMAQAAEILGKRKDEVLSLMFKGKLKFTTLRSKKTKAVKRIIRRGDVMAAKALLVADQQ